MAAEAGADLVLIHSTDPSGSEAVAISENWDGRTPLMSIPTALADLRPDDLGRLGYTVVVYANHALRATILATRQLLVDLRQTGCSVADEVSMADVLKILDSFPRPKGV